LFTLYALSSVIHGQEGERLTLRSFTLADRSQVTFHATPAGLEPQPPVLEEQETVERRFKFSVNYKDVSWAPQCGCYRTYEFYFQRSTGGPTTRFKVKAVPSGRLQDQWQQISFDIESGSVRDTGSISLPLAGSDSFQAVENASEPRQEVHLRGTSTIILKLKNGLPNSDIILEPPQELIDYDERLWYSPPKLKRIDSAQIRVPGGRTTALHYEVRPRPMEAVARSFFKVRPTDEHASLQLAVPYRNAHINDRSGQLEASIALRFKPILLLLGAGLLGGWALGSIARLLQSKQRRDRQAWTRSSATGLAVALIVEVVALFMVAMQSRFVFFDFELNPWETFPTVIIGLVCGLLGDESYNAIRRLLNLDDAQPQPGKGRAVTPAGR
jgi:hypothetical protein